MADERPRRRRDPARKARILAAAAELIARGGYHAVGMSDIGAAAGIVGSGIYRHFSGKSAILAALLEEVMDRLKVAAAEIVTQSADDRVMLTRLVESHVEVAVRDRRLLQVYYREVRNLPEDDLRRLRRAQRRDLSDGELRLTVHAAIGAVQSILFHHSGLPQDRVRRLLADMAHACLGVPPADAVMDAVVGAVAGPGTPAEAPPANAE